MHGQSNGDGPFRLVTNVGRLVREQSAFEFGDGDVLLDAVGGTGSLTIANISGHFFLSVFFSEPIALTLRLGGKTKNAIASTTKTKTASKKIRAMMGLGIDPFIFALNRA